MNAILVINSGSSSIKLQVIKMPSETVVASGLIERIGLENSALHLTIKGTKKSKELEIPDHETGLKEITRMLLDKENGVIKNTAEIKAVGHRVVHGGAAFSDTIEVNDAVKESIKELFSLAPLHNPPNYKGIEVAEKIFPEAKQVAVFDTAFHQSIPLKAKKYAIPNEFQDKHGLQVYGFHGISHKYVSEKAGEFLKKKQGKYITIHLGNGCSITATKNGKSIDHSLGFGPVNGLIMGTRSGDIDQSVIFYMIEKLGYTAEEVSEILHKKSGMLGLTGMSDLRDIEEAAEKGDEACQLALEMNAYRIKKYIGAYMAAMNGVDAIVFTAGIGENSDILRELVCRDMEYLGIELEPYKNNIRSKEPRVISKENSRVAVLVVPTNEELEIAKQTYELL
ncbi:acetate kinase [Robertkochia marina]|uniref:Acetate kinase n=1 Tax=Robertkochia marina TaxID=1227945 RepID=A0A4V3UY74_9FLAO|nr:acetate kinase [Robertkochia marina]THD67806.1 acetate kinase [Robertkochia marina]TRZ41720.1 acetate kinase [Robertkochia marina]